MISPIIHSIEEIKFPKPELITLHNQIQLYGFNGSKNDILRIDLVFDSGKWTEPAPHIAEAVAKLFKSGTSKLSSFEINEQIDFYGTTLKCSAGYNTFTISVYCMHRFLEPSLQLLQTCLTEIIFPEHEIELMQKNAISKLKVNLEKNDFIASAEFKKLLFGNAHPYGYAYNEANIKNITQKLLVQFYTQDIHPSNCTVFIAGKYGEKELELINQYIGKWSTKNEYKKQDLIFTSTLTNQKKHPIKKEKSVQASIIIGKEFIHKKHHDYAAFTLLNTLFGAYFGSRLMSNIREEKGLTYGIYSSLSTLKNTGILAIQTDTNLENLELCLQEIYFEMQRLQDESIPEQEITLARNYLLGKYLGRTDGVFNQIDVFKSYFVEGIDINKFEEFVSIIKQTNAVTLQQLAQQYLQKESMVEVVVG
ncbi:MAG TPA: pitrilysin family protein [Chitinophagales bacterium]|jgi:zinc protease|nr:insulinase family protein [Chitinophagales bacterium]MBP6155027.1 insulinase family protein [Chitinophagales bacterium]HQV77248.1 pitrilysin family protein [Chitinophagales bacterium]HQW79747.1 pitrilysin family protein [Chitinophagales bacterium]HRB18895.1 pitrilysin family protein [Chitinophagales bacterium]